MRRRTIASAAAVPVLLAALLLPGSAGAITDGYLDPTFDGRAHFGVIGGVDQSTGHADRGRRVASALQGRECVVAQYHADG